MLGVLNNIYGWFIKLLIGHRAYGSSLRTK